MPYSVELIRFPKYKEPIKLNLGCASYKMEGYIGIDIEDFGHNMVWDVRKGLPFPDESVEDIYSSHFLEHLDDDSSIFLFFEVQRVLKKGCSMKNRLPHVQHATAFYAGHKTFWNQEKVAAIMNIPGLEGLKIIVNEKIGAELFFTLMKK